MITWLHLSDLHFRASKLHAWDEDVVLQQLLDDVLRCLKEYQLVLDFVLVSGDIAFSGSAAEYAMASGFFDELLAITGLSEDQLFLVPGNHDVDRTAISSGAETIVSSCTGRQAVDRALIQQMDRELILSKFHNYAEFVQRYLGDHRLTCDEHYCSVRTLQRHSREISVLGLNSAWLSYGDHDRNHLALGERQVHQAIKASLDADLRIAMLHHPFDWLQDTDHEACEALLMDHCDFVLHGHLHRVGLLMQRSPDARAMFVGAGACYEARQSRNSYNLVRLDLDTLGGTVFLRSWSSNQGGFWTRDVHSYRSVEDGEIGFELGRGRIVPHPPEKMVQGVWTQDALTYRDVQDGRFVFSVAEYRDVVPANGDSLAAIVSRFSRHTDRALRHISLKISGVPDSLPMEEVARVEEQLNQQRPVLLTGEAGVGKSGIAARLVQMARARGIPVLLLDARRVGPIRNEAELRQHFDLRGPLGAAVERAGRYEGCRLVVDQLDNIAGSTAANLLVDLAVDCSKCEGVEVVVVSRKREAHEIRLLDGLTAQDFVELTCHPMSESEAEELLRHLEITQRCRELVSLARNLLNLDLIGRIKQERPDFDFCALMEEADLWERYVQVMVAREEAASAPEEAQRVIAVAVELARAGLSNEDRTFCLEIPVTRPQRRLDSWGLIVPVEGRVYRYSHEKLQDYLVAWDAVQRNLMPATVLRELGSHRARNVLVWMENIYSRSNAKLHREFLREAFNVRQ